MKPLVSVLICTLNSEEYIEETLKSVLNQTYTNIEIRILDNWSTDKTLDIIKNFDDDRIILYSSNYNLGAFEWLNYLIDRSEWEFIAIQDHDDLWLPKKIEMQVSFLLKNKNFIGCWTNTTIYFEGDWKWYDYYFWDYTTYVIHPSLMFRNFNQHYNSEREYMCDCYFMKKVLCHWQKNLYNLPWSPLVIHRVRSWLKNYSYKWFKFTKLNLNTIFYCHYFVYWCLVVWFEFLRRLLYPFLSEKWIYKFERLPFILRWYKIYDVRF